MERKLYDKTLFCVHFSLILFFSLLTRILYQILLHLIYICILYLHTLIYEDCEGKKKRITKWQQKKRGGKVTLSYISLIQVYNYISYICTRKTIIIIMGCYVIVDTLRCLVLVRNSHYMTMMMAIVDRIIFGN